MPNGFALSAIRTNTLIRLEAILNKGFRDILIACLVRHLFGLPLILITDDTFSKIGRTVIRNAYS